MTFLAIVMYASGLVDLCFTITRGANDAAIHNLNRETYNACVWLAGISSTCVCLQILSNSRCKPWSLAGCTTHVFETRCRDMGFMLNKFIHWVGFNHGLRSREVLANHGYLNRYKMVGMHWFFSMANHPL